MNKCRKTIVCHRAGSIKAGSIKSMAQGTGLLCKTCQEVVDDSPIGFLMRFKDDSGRWFSKICDNCRRQVDKRHEQVTAGSFTFPFER